VSPELLSIVVLAAMFVLATWRDVNMGWLGYVAALVVGGVALGLPAEDYLSGFPVDLFLTLVGLTFLFGFAQDNGVIEVVVHWCVRLVRGRVGVMPWVFFGLTAVLISLGALFAVAIVTPLALTFARRHGINQFMTGLLVVHGALAGAFSPVSVYGIFINDFLVSNGFDRIPLTLFLAPLLFNLVFAIVVFLVLRRRTGPVSEADLRAQEEARRSGEDLTAAVPQRLDGFQWLTLAALLAMAVAVVAFGWDVGVVTIVLATVLAIVRPAAGKAALGRVSWGVVVLITGVLTYIEVLERAGTVEWVSGGITSIGIPLLAALLLFYLAGFVSALASSLAIIGVVMALAVPFLASGDVSVAGFVAALAIAATIVDISPFSTNGAMLLANVDAAVRDDYYRRMLGYAGLMCLIGPGLAWVVAAGATGLGV
jgi:di/tricarboxylate transporter